MEKLSRNAPAALLAAAFCRRRGDDAGPDPRLTFLGDTWEFLMNRRDPSVDALLQPHNEHIVVFPVAIEELLCRLFGMTTALPEYVVADPLPARRPRRSLFVYARRRVGPWPALFAAVLLLFLGPAWEVLLWPFEITFVGPVLSGWRRCWRSNARTGAATSPPASC